MRRHFLVCVAATLCASLFVTSLAQAEPLPCNDPDTVPVGDEAKAHFRRGVTLIDDPDGERWEEAYRAFKAAFSASPSPKILGNLAVGAMKLERDDEAIQAFRCYLDVVADVPAAEREQFSKDVATLEQGSAAITITIEPAGATVSDERVAVRGSRIINRYPSPTTTFTTRVRAGHHVVNIELAGHDTVTWEFDAQAGGVLEHRVTLVPTKADVPPPPPQPPVMPMSRPMPTSVYVALGATGAAVVGGVIVGVLALGKKSDFDALNDGTRQSEAVDLRDAGQTLNVVTDVLIGAAVVGAVVTTVLYVTRPEVPMDDVTVTPLASPYGGGLLLQTHF